MSKLLDVLQQWHSSAFNAALKQQLEALPEGSLPLENGLTRCGIVDDSHISVTVINARQVENGVEARIGVFFTEIVAGCVCGEDPTAENAYLELRVTIDQITGDAHFEPIPE